MVDRDGDGRLHARSRGLLDLAIALGDLLLVPSCGAYTSASATNFNCFAKAKILVWEDVQAEYGDQFLAAVG